MRLWIIIACSVAACFALPSADNTAHRLNKRSIFSDNSIFPDPNYSGKDFFDVLGGYSDLIHNNKIDSMYSRCVEGQCGYSACAPGQCFNRLCQVNYMSGQQNCFDYRPTFSYPEFQPLFDFNKEFNSLFSSNFFDDDFFNDHHGDHETGGRQPVGYPPNNNPHELENHVGSGQRPEVHHEGGQRPENVGGEWSENNNDDGQRPEGPHQGGQRPEIHHEGGQRPENVGGQRPEIHHEGGQRPENVGSQRPEIHHEGGRPEGQRPGGQRPGGQRPEIHEQGDSSQSGSGEEGGYGSGEPGGQGENTGGSGPGWPSFFPPSFSDSGSGIVDRFAEVDESDIDSTHSSTSFACDASGCRHKECLNGKCTEQKCDVNKKNCVTVVPKKR